MVIYFYLLIFSVTSLTSFQSSDLAHFLNHYFKLEGIRSLTTMTSFLIFTGPLNAFKFLLVIFIYFLSFFLYQQHYSSALRIPSGTSKKILEMAILWNYLWNLSHYMWRVEWGRRQRETLNYWEMSKIQVLVNFTSLLSTSANHVTFSRNV